MYSLPETKESTDHENPVQELEHPGEDLTATAERTRRQLWNRDALFSGKHSDHPLLLMMF